MKALWALPRAFLLLHAGLAAFSFYWVVGAPRQVEVTGYLETYQVARALYQFGAPVLPDMGRFEAMAAPLRTLDGAWGADRSLIERWIEEEPRLSMAQPLKLFQKRPFLYESIVAGMWRLLGRESFKAVMILNWACLNLGLCLLTLLAWRGTGSIRLSVLPALLTGLYTHPLWLAMNAGMHVLLFPVGLALGWVLQRSLRGPRSWAWSGLFGAGAGFACLLHGSSVFWLPVAAALWMLQGLRRPRGAGTRRPLAEAALRMGAALALFFLTLSPVLLYHHRHTGHIFLGIGGVGGVMQGLGMYPDNPMGYPYRARDLNDDIVRRGYAGPTRWEDDPQSYDLDVFAGRVLREDLRTHWRWVLGRILARPLWMPFPYLYARHHEGRYGVKDYVRYSGPLQMSWERTEAPPAADMEGLGARYLDAGRLEAFRTDLRSRPLKRLALYSFFHPGALVNRIYVLLLAPLLAVLAALPLVLLVMNPSRYSGLAPGLPFLVKALFFVAVFPSQRYLCSDYGAAFLAGVLGLAALVRPRGRARRETREGERVVLFEGKPVLGVRALYRALGFRAAALPAGSEDRLRGAPKAFRLSLPLYDRLLRERFGLSRGPIGLFPERAEDAFRKALLEELSEVVRLRFALRRARREFPGAETAFLPADPRVCAWAGAYAAALGRGSETLLEGVPRGWMLAGSLADSMRRAKLLAILLDALARSGLRALSRGSAGRRKVKVGIALLSPREFRTPERWLRALVDGRAVRAEEALFIAHFALTGSQRAVLDRLGFEAVEPYAMALPVPPSAWRGAAAAVPRVLRLLWSAPLWAAEVGVYAVKDFLIWTAFLERFQLREFITYDAEYSFRQNLRNALLKREGARTWFYAATVNVESLYMARRRGVPAPQPLYGYLDYDLFVGWAPDLWPAPRTYFHLHRPRIGRYLFVGCLWAEQILALREAGETPLLRRLREAGYDPGRQKLVAAFDCSFLGALNSGRDGVRYAGGLRRFLDEHDDVFLVWKEKQPRAWTEARHPERAAAYRSLERHPRCLFTGSEVSAAEVLALCGLAVSFPFTSPTVEALCARVPALYYDPSRKYLDSWFDRFPRLVTHGYEDLREAAEEWLYRTSPAQASDYFERHIRGPVDPFLDGRALSRLREMLAGEPVDDVLSRAGGTPSHV